MLLFPALARMIAESHAAVVITVLAARGSVPREAGARMVVDGKGGFHGTIGGGNLEWQALAHAQGLLREAVDRFETRRYALGPELGQCCGGALTLGFELFTSARLEDVARLAALERQGPFETLADLGDVTGALKREVVTGSATRGAFAELGDGFLSEGFGIFRRPVYLYGAGHVGRAIMLALAPLDFALHWVDERAEMFPPVIPAAVEVHVTCHPADLAASAPQGAMALILTHNHALDLDILHAALKAGQHAHIGMIGSATKRARFEKRLQELGLPRERARSFQCPIGVPELKGKEPAVIAAGVACDLLLKAQGLAAGKGVREDTGKRARRAASSPT